MESICAKCLEKAWFFPTTFLTKYYISNWDWFWFKVIVSILQQAKHAFFVFNMTIEWVTIRCETFCINRCYSVDFLWKKLSIWIDVLSTNIRLLCINTENSVLFDIKMFWIYYKVWFWWLISSFDKDLMTKKMRDNWTFSSLKLSFDTYRLFIKILLINKHYPLFSTLIYIFFSKHSCYHYAVHKSSRRAQGNLGLKNLEEESILYFNRWVVKFKKKCLCFMVLIDISLFLFTLIIAKYNQAPRVINQIYWLSQLLKIKLIHVFYNYFCFVQGLSLSISIKRC